MSYSLLIFIIGALCISYVQSQIIVAPTTHNSVSEVYDTSIPNEYENDTIVCTKLSCTVICDTRKGCYYTTINASISETLILKCLAIESCKNINIISGQHTSTDISCKNNASCSYANFNASNSVTFNLECDEYVSSCSGAVIYCPLHNQCDITCAVGQYVCKNMDIHIQDKDADINLEFASSSLQTAEFLQFICDDTSLRSELKTNTNAGEWSCDTDKCCPYSFYEEILTCNASSSCIVDCVTNDCSLFLINGSYASSLTVNCADGGCGGTHILCPTNNNSPCYTQCEGDNSCIAMFIMATESYSLDLVCKGSETCYDTEIYCPSDRMDACNINCGNDFEVCREMDIHPDVTFIAGYLNINCPDSGNNGSCNDVYLNCNNSTQSVLTFNSTDSAYQCKENEKNNASYCCPWIYASDPINDATITPTIEPTMNPTKPRIIPIIEPTINIGNNSNIMTQSETSISSIAPIIVPATEEPTASPIYLTTVDDDRITIIRLTMLVFDSTRKLVFDNIEAIFYKSIDVFFEYINIKATHNYSVDKNIITVDVLIMRSKENINLTQFRRDRQIDLNNEYGEGVVVITSINISIVDEDKPKTADNSLFILLIIIYIALTMIFVVSMLICFKFIKNKYDDTPSININDEMNIKHDDKLQSFPSLPSLPSLPKIEALNQSALAEQDSLNIEGNNDDIYDNVATTTMSNNCHDNTQNDDDGNKMWMELQNNVHKQ